MMIIILIQMFLLKYSNILYRAQKSQGPLVSKREIDTWRRNAGNGDEDGAVSVRLDAADAGLEMFSRKFEARDRSG